MNDLTRLELTVDRFSQFITSLPAWAQEEKEWGPMEVLAHLVYHHELYVSLVEAELSGETIEPPKGRFRDLNAAAVAASRGIDPGELVTRFQNANHRLVELYRQNDPKAITIEIKAGAKPRTLAELVTEANAHIRNHHEKLHKALNTQAKR